MTYTRIEIAIGALTIGAIAVTATAMWVGNPATGSVVKSVHTTGESIMTDYTRTEVAIGAFALAALVAVSLVMWVGIIGIAWRLLA